MNQNIKKRKNSQRSILLLALAIITLPVWSGQVDENIARKVAAQTLERVTETQNADSVTQLRTQAVLKKTVQLIYKSSSKTNSGNATLRSTRANTKETVYFYVFGGENNKGFVIVSGDDRVTPVLGYSDTNGFPVDDMPPNLKWWIGEYARQIEFAIDNDIEPTLEVKQQWAQYLVGNNDKDVEE